MAIVWLRTSLNVTAAPPCVGSLHRAHPLLRIIPEHQQGLHAGKASAVSYSFTPSAALATPCTRSAHRTCRITKRCEHEHSQCQNWAIRITHCQEIDTCSQVFLSPSLCHTSHLRAVFQVESGLEGDWGLIVPDTIEHPGAVQHPELGGGMYP